jgi:hypothetical protein
MKDCRLTVAFSIDVTLHSSFLPGELAPLGNLYGECG